MYISSICRTPAKLFDVVLVFFGGHGAGATRLQAIWPHSAAGNDAFFLHPEPNAQQADYGKDAQYLFYEFREFHALFSMDSKRMESGTPLGDKGRAGGSAQIQYCGFAFIFQEAERTFLGIFLDKNTVISRRPPILADQRPLPIRFFCRAPLRS